MTRLAFLFIFILSIVSPAIAGGTSFIHSADTISTEIETPELQNRSKFIHYLSATLGFDYVASSTEDNIREKIPKDEKISVHTAIPLNFRYSFSFTDPSIRNYFPGGYQGIGGGILNLGGLEAHGIQKSRKYIGYPVSVYVFQGGPFWKIKHGLSLGYEWAFGASFGWKPYSESTKYFNLTVGSRVNAYLNLSFLLQWQLNSHTEFWCGVSASHFSNGNTSFPNPGVNAFGIRAGVVYTLNPLPKGFPEPLTDTLKSRKVVYDILLWGATRKRVFRGLENQVLLPGHYACAGVSFAPMIKLDRWWRLGGSADLQWDQSSDMKKNYIEGTTTEDIKFSTPNFFRQLTFGLSAHIELQMPIFALNLGIGYNIVSPWENRGCYQNIALKTYLCSKLYLNIGYQLRNFYQQSSLMAGLGITI